jgi:hypothetical protein
MRIEIQLRIVADDNSVISEGEIVHFDKGDDRLEGIGLSFDEAKAALAGIQGGTAQAASFLARHRSCDLCDSLLLSKADPVPRPGSFDQRQSLEAHRLRVVRSDLHEKKKAPHYWVRGKGDIC